MELPTRFNAVSRGLVKAHRFDDSAEHVAQTGKPIAADTVVSSGAGWTPRRVLRTNRLPAHAARAIGGRRDPDSAFDMDRALTRCSRVGADPISLGVLQAPGAWGADIVVGPTQPLGVHMHGGGGVGGYMGTAGEERVIREYNGLLVSINRTAKPRQVGLGLCSPPQPSSGTRALGKGWAGD